MFARIVLLTLVLTAYYFLPDIANIWPGIWHAAFFIWFLLLIVYRTLIVQSESEHDI